MEKETLESVLAKHGITILPDFSAGKQRNGSQWMFCNEAAIGEKTVRFVSFGDFKTGVEGSWSDAQTAAEKKALDQFLKKKSPEKEELKRTLWEETRAEVLRFIREETVDRGQPTPYLVKKKIDKLLGARIHVNSHGSAVLIVPMQDVEDTVWNYQRIFPEKLDHGDKFFIGGARVEGCFYLFGHIHPEGKIYIAEGFATGASIFLAFGETQTVVSAFTADNLLAVGRALLEKYPKAKLIFCADNDAFTLVQGQPKNVGLLKARAAAAACQGEVVYPHFDDLQARPTDFNDLHVLRGLDTVRDQIENPDNYRAELEPIPAFDQRGKPQKPLETEVVRALLRHLGDDLLKQERDLFVYRDTHWVHLKADELDLLRQKLYQLGGPEYGSRDVASAWANFLTHAPAVPYGLNLFRPNRYAANFRNGTLYLERRSDGVYLPRFQAGHRREDYLTYCLEYDFLPESKERNPEFEKMLERVWKDDPFASDKIRAYKQHLGAALAPLFPNIALFVGPPASGKSTLLKIARKLVPEQFRGSLDPTLFGKDFHLYSLVGKLVNIVTDINLTHPISDSVVKMVVDQVEMHINRKQQSMILAPIAPLHLWGGNGLPKTRGEASGAFQRRMTVFETSRLQLGTVYDKEFDEWVWEQGPQGIVNAAVEGLLDLCAARGHFHKIPDSAGHIQRMESEGDTIQQWLDDIRTGVILDDHTQLIAEKSARIERKHAFDLYAAWFREHHGNQPRLGKTKFFEAVRRKGIDDHPIKGVDYFHGIGVVVVQSASH